MIDLKVFCLSVLRFICFRHSYFIAILFKFLSVPFVALGQGAAAVFPLSMATDSRSGAIDFLLQNLQTSDLLMKYEPLCDVDGKELKGNECLEIFDVKFSIPMKDNHFTIPKNEKLDGKVSLKAFNFKYALYKPNFDPVLNSDKETARNKGSKSEKSGSVSFAFGYQPGYLFVLNPVQEQLNIPTFKVFNFDTMRRARFTFPISSLTSPALINVSAKLVDQKTGKLVRFLALAREKIVDPKRVELVLEGDYTRAGDARDVCYELFVDNRFAKINYKLSNCSKAGKAL